MRQSIGQAFNLLLWPGGRAFEYFVNISPQIISLGGEFLLYLTSHFCPGDREFYSNFLENGKSLLYAPHPPPPPRQLDIDRCITCISLT